MSNQDPSGPQQQPQPGVQWADGWGDPGQGTQPGPPQQNRPAQQGPVQQGPMQQGPVQQGPIQQGPIQQGPMRQGPYPPPGHPQQQRAGQPPMPGRPPMSGARKPSPALGIVALVLTVLAYLPMLFGIGGAAIILFAVPALICALIALLGNKGRIFGLIALVLLLLPIGRIVLGFAS